MSPNFSAKYYQSNKERLQKNIVKDSKRQYCCERYKNLSEDEKSKLVEYRKKYFKMRKNTLL